MAGVDAPADRGTEPSDPGSSAAGGSGPVLAAPPPPPTTDGLEPDGGRSRGRWLRIAGASGVALLIAALAFFGYRTSQDLASARNDNASLSAQLASTQSELASTQSELASTQSELATQTAARTAAVQESERLNRRILALEQRVSRQTECINTLTTQEAELNRILEEGRTNFNRTSKGSKFADARLARETALNAALTDYYTAYQQAFNRNYSAANSWVAKGNAEASKGNTQLSIIESEIAAIDATTKQIEADLTALRGKLDLSRAMCATAATPSA